MEPNSVFVPLFAINWQMQYKRNLFTYLYFNPPRCLTTIQDARRINAITNTFNNRMAYSLTLTNWQLAEWVPSQKTWNKSGGVIKARTEILLLFEEHEFIWWTWKHVTSNLLFTGHYSLVRSEAMNQEYSIVFVCEHVIISAYFFFFVQSLDTTG